ncbi:Protein CBG00944 [Caenorhabditis briggsae]|uniref:Uncharacterized protein n=2 Tax=Caenorhabditis briggsae TaxID=6238 RepID=A0AAE9DG91_CAEBR|nr:Protein CBG00944 [Caenorhabditis briggsae]ULU03744.1 hypothetical protein L3Y34_016904 [Caenorhabditis briggsae]CAP22306.1 Protein CBG00944 [Caenorhabditis briggsae]
MGMTGRLLLFVVVVVMVFVMASEAMRAKRDNCKSEKLRELVLETVGIYPHQYSYQAKYLKQQAEERFGFWWSAVIVSERGGYGMSAVYDQYKNTSCEMMLFDTYYWIGRTC